MFLNVNEIRDKVSIVELLSKLGHSPAYKSGKELFYLSMLREEKTPSLCVNEELGVWFDHGGPNHSGIKGGNVIDLGLAFWYPVSFPDVLRKLKDTCSIEITSAAPSDYTNKSRPRLARKLPHYQIENVRPVGNNPAITGFLEYRGVLETAAQHLNEVYYYVEDEKKNRKSFFAAGWQNENMGWEVRNKYFKGCIGRKGVTFISGDPRELAVFEGYLDFLSWKINLPSQSASVLVLNTLSFLERAVSIASAYQRVKVFFDNDDAGKKATDQFIAAVPKAQDHSFLYNNYKDYNEMIMSIKLKSRLINIPAQNLFASAKIGFSR